MMPTLCHYLMRYIQDWLAGSSIFSTLHLQSGYWQLPVNPADKEKTAFCPGPGMGPDPELITVSIIPEALQQDALYQAHDIPGSGHQGHDRTLQSYAYVLIG